ncbi:putative SMP domain-containing protein [Seiridium cardinale]
MAPGEQELRNIADQAERDLNSYQAKTGAGKSSSSDDAGVDSRVENKFPGAQVQYDTDLSTNASYNKRIPPGEGGDLDSRGRQAIPVLGSRQTRGEHFEGEGGPEHKLAQQQRDFGGEDTYDPSGRRQPQGSDSYETGNRDAMSEGKEYVQSNLQSEGIPREKNKFPGSDYYTPESVPGSISSAGYEAPGSVTQASRESENY